MSVTTTGKTSTRRLGILVGITALYFILTNLPVPDGLSPKALNGIAMMACAVLVWVLDYLPIAVSAILFTVLPAAAGIMPLPKMMSNFATPTIFFVFGMFIISIAFQNCGISRRIVLWTSLKSHGDPKRFLLFMMMTSAILSSFLADIPVCAMMFPVALLLLESNNCLPGKSMFGRAVMIGLPMACLIGGVGTPAGSAMNVLTLGMLNNMVQINITFFKWMCFGMPMVLLLTPVAWFVLTRVYRPEINVIKGMDKMEEEYNALGAMTSAQIRFLCFLAFNFLLWSTCDLIHLPLPVAALIGASIFVLPGIGFLDWAKDKNRIGWDILMLIGACNALGMVIFETGGAEWLCKLCLGDMGSLSPMMIVGIISAFTIVAHLLVPVNTALVAVLLPALVVLAQSMGVNAALFALPLGFSVSAALLLPLDPVSLVTYPAGYYRMYDMIKPGIWISIFWVILMVLVMFVLAHPLGFI